MSETKQVIQKLTSKLLELKEREKELVAESRAFAEKRNELNERFKSLRAEILELKTERDRLNAEVKELKRQRNAAKMEINIKIEEITKTRKEFDALSKRKPSKSFQTLQKEFESVEWKIQTTPLSLKDERELVEHIKQLESQLNTYRRLDQLNQKLVELKAELTALKTKSNAFHEKMTETAQKSQKIHEKMLEKIDESKKLKAEADRLHALFLQIKEKLKPVQEEIFQISSQIKMLEEKEKRKIEGDIRKKLARQAKEKLKRGEKLTWEEFQLLAEKGIKA
ncbi:MAG: hypothetical protein QXI91_02015 [Candidatus Bathyarchaeia archaeon]